MRKLRTGGKDIYFDHWRSAFEWDQNSHSMKRHEKLTLHHFKLDSRSKMRNQLAEDVLNDKMLNLMTVYQKDFLSPSFPK